LQLEAVEKITVNKTTDNITAYELYLKARPMFLARNDLDLADEFLINAIELDENFSQAWEMRAALQFLMVEYRYTYKSAIEQRLLAEKFALKALSINPKSALAKSSLANIGTYKADGSDNYSVNIIDLFNESIEIDPNNATTYNWRGLTYSAFGMLDEALLDFQRCIEIEPLYSACYSNVMTSPLTLKSGQAEAFLNEGLGKDIINIQYLDLPWLAQNRKESLFKIVVNQKENLGGWGRADELYQAYLYPEQDHRQLIDDIVTFYEKSKPNDSISVQLRMILVPIGAYELAPDAATMWGMGFKVYRQSDEFKSYVKDSGIYQYWLERGFPPQCKPIGEEDFECE
jgi:adenylate cyclase